MRTDRGRPLVLVLGVLLLLLVSVPAAAHTGGESHRAIVSVEKDAVRALLMMQVPEGRRATSLLTRFDLNRDGDLDALEGQLLAGHLGAEVVGGWSLKVGNASPVPKSLDARATVSDSGGVLVALLLEYPPATRGERVRVRVLASPAGSSPVKAAPVVVEMQASDGVFQSSHPVAPDAPVMGPLVLKPGGAGAWLRTR